ncbi:hypothetical protein [Clostridium sp.]|uniref:hypothetical protein n=1 Tax=Clostridium sp. TaxID=1506 RepID=UPI00321691F1
MNKKKIILGIVISIVIAIIVWIDIPYLFPSKNLISKNNYDYTYRQVNIEDFDSVDSSTWIDNTEDGKVDKLISIIDDLSFKKAKIPKDQSEYSLNFIGTYKEDEYNTYAKEVFSIRFYEDNVIGFQEKPESIGKYYKIQDKEFDIKKIIEELQ